jgi:alkylation response protein AidB-like acyl-CoA dehydrogenase
VITPGWTDELVKQAIAAGEDIPTLVRLARDYGSLLPMPGTGDTGQRWRVLTAVGGANLSAARVFEAHTDGLAILAEAGFDPLMVGSMGALGVFAAEGPGLRVSAEPSGEHYRLNGTKPWCSLGADLDAALVTAHVGDGRQLFLVDLHEPSVRAEPPAAWVARGLPTITSTSLTFRSTPAQPVGEVGWYLTRAGFQWGGIGVAAAWYGGALALQQRLAHGAGTTPDPLARLAIGRVDVALHAAGLALAHAATAVDTHAADAADEAELLALRTRAVVVDAVERTLIEVAHALGPAPLAFEAEHARRVADLELYIRQHHADRDLATLGGAVGRRSASAPPTS